MAFSQSDPQAHLPQEQYAKHASFIIMYILIWRLLHNGTPISQFIPTHHRLIFQRYAQPSRKRRCSIWKRASSPKRSKAVRCSANTLACRSGMGVCSTAGGFSNKTTGLTTEYTSSPKCSKLMKDSAQISTFWSGLDVCTDDADFPNKTRGPSQELLLVLWKLQALLLRSCNRRLRGANFETGVHSALLQSRSSSCSAGGGKSALFDLGRPEVQHTNRSHSPIKSMLDTLMTSVAR
mmetsp:Transcript_13731/g.34811  ORF Transcript_13731/g.34811 Transcript_13731/m.34811 type:complete len:236 (-) Transcript_13731:67-774(-)